MHTFFFSALILIVLVCVWPNGIGGVNPETSLHGIHSNVPVQTEHGNAQQPPTEYKVSVDGQDYMTADQRATHFSFKGSNLTINGKCYENHPTPKKRILSRATDLENDENDRLKEQQSLHKASSSKNAEAAVISSDDENYYSLSESEHEESNPGTSMYVPAPENNENDDGHHILVPDEPAQSSFFNMPSMPRMPSMPSMSKISSILKMLSMPKLPSMPKLSSMPAMPSTMPSMSKNESSDSDYEEGNPGNYVYVPASENDESEDGYYIFVPDEPEQGFDFLFEIGPGLRNWVEIDIRIGFSDLENP
ncbi:hypothetical protein niasHT_029813 [Heterodera trifolii]|uniref:Effector protein n=1 Tax=Heterodera trifolii TaxID=157864 RepID=A0ABD2K3Q3_9BILA